MATNLTPAATAFSGIFSPIGAAPGGTLLGNGFGVAAGADLSAFAMTLGNSLATPQAGLSTGANALLKTVAVNAAAHKAALNAKEDSTDLGSPDLLLSDLMAVNWQALQPGQTIDLPNGWSLSADQDGLLTLQNAAQGLSFPPFTKDQLQQALNMFAPPLPQAAGENSDTDKKASTTSDHTANDTSAQKKAQSPAAQKVIEAAVANGGATGRESNATNPLMDLVAAAKDSAKSTDGASRHASLLALFGNPGTGTSGQSNTNSNAAAAGLGAATSVSISQPHQRVSPLTASTEGLLLNTPLSDGTIVQGDSAAFSSTLSQQFAIRTEKDGSLTGTQPMSTAQLQLVIQKLAERGENRTLSLRLDPPELGRVQVDLSIARDKTIKASIMVEKPEALTLLHKDLASLEKALHAAGVNLEDGSVTLNLADQNNGQGGFAQQAFQDMWQEKNSQNFASRDEIDTDLALSVSGQELPDDTNPADGSLNVVI